MKTEMNPAEIII